MKKYNFLFGVLIGAVMLTSCNNDVDQSDPLGSYENGILVLNEGDFNSGSVTYISNDLTTVQQDIFTVVNGTGQSLGGYVQSMFFEGNRAFIISNGSNKITVVNRYTFEYLATISTGLIVPRYGVVYNGKAYITNLNTFESSTDDYVAVINLGDLSVAPSIPIGNYTERIVEANGKLYVTSGSFGSGDKITVINANTQSVETTITVGNAPNSLEVMNGILYVLCSSFSDSSKLVKIDLLDNSVDEVVFPASMANAQNLDIEGNHAYFSVGPKVYKVSITDTTVTDTPLFDTGSSSAFVGYGFAVNGDRIYISEAAQDFSSDGKIFVYSTSGALIDEIPVGLGPNGFYFN